jgi:hypothetical protein
VENQLAAKTLEAAKDHNEVDGGLDGGLSLLVATGARTKRTTITMNNRIKPEMSLNVRVLR